MPDTFSPKCDLPVWSATPTPFATDGTLDHASVERMIEHHLHNGVDGLFLAGTCGEGPVMREQQILELTRLVAQRAAGRIAVTVQVTDNSAARTLDRIAAAADQGAEVAILAEPWFRAPLNCTSWLHDYYFRTVEEATLPVGIYLREELLTLDQYKQLFRHPHVRLIKDSSGSVALRTAAAEARRERDDLLLLTGNEFTVLDYMDAGYDGALAGGGILVGGLMKRMLTAWLDNQRAEAEAICKRIHETFAIAYGGSDVRGWLTGLKYTMVKLGIFSSEAGYLQFPLPAEQRRAIDEMVERDATELLGAVTT